MIYGYARVSTVGQKRDGNSLEEQVTTLKRHNCDEIVYEAYTGKTMDRPKFNELLGKLQPGDTLVVTKLDRFARTAVEGVQTVRSLFDKGIMVRIDNMGLIENTLTGNLILTVMLAFAEYERGVIVERTQTGKAIAKANNPNFKDGRKKRTFDDGEFERLQDEVRAGRMTVTECCKALGISRTLWYSRIKEVA